MLIISTAEVLAHEPDQASIDATMRDIGIMYIISDDRKLPKENRIKWEAGLAEYIDFASLNQGMKERVKAAIKLADEANMDETMATQIAEKAVRFLVPRELSNYMQAYLRAKAKVAELLPCDQVYEQETADGFTLCVRHVSKHERHVVFMGDDLSQLVSLEFQKRKRWMLVNINAPISEKKLLTLTMWK
ncbi:hypothetical protein [Marinicella litoralis]|uniref:hypothetical protein n=1 Tax=Marinicella litoralis TaxID=644220 RepID=UPI00105E0A73|nr:hypothetical protein [Marinicella litoralis]